LIKKALGTADHDRQIAGLTYVYPVISRRSGGLSIGINFNPNNACNWRCIYCQVPDLKRGSAPILDIEILRSELELLLDDIISGEFYERFEVPPEAREIKDIALSGNGEPSSLTNFHEAVSTIAHTAKNKKIFPACKFILITNGSLLHKPNVCQGLVCLAQNNGEIWFKLDSATTEGRRLLNNSRQSRKHLVNNLKIASEHCPTKLQTCMLHYGDAWSNDEKTAYLSLLTELQRQNISIRGVMLYSLARPSLQPEAPSLDKASELEIKAFAADIEKLGYDVSVNG